MEERTVHEVIDSDTRKLTPRGASDGVNIPKVWLRILRWWKQPLLNVYLVEGGHIIISSTNLKGSTITISRNHQE